MKIRITKLISLLTLVFLLNNCTSGLLVTSSAPPPGQAKKQTGSQSAKPYAPGQQKKAAGSQSAKQFAPGQQKKKN